MIHYDDIDVSCPYCGEKNVLKIELTINRSDEFISDCEVCCRAFTVNVFANSDGDLNVDVKNDEGF